MRIKILAALSALAVALGMVAFASMSSSAHQGNIVATALCNTTTGNYDVTYTLSWSNVPNGVHAAMSSRTGATSFHSGWTYNTWSDWTSRGDSTGNQGSIQWTEQMPGDTVGNGPWVYAYTNWSNGYSGSRTHDTRMENLGGDCAIPTPLNASATASSVPATCDAPGSVTFATENAEWENTTDVTDGSRRAIAHQGHLFPGGETTIDVGYVIQPQQSGVGCLTLVTPETPTVANSMEVCNSTNGSTTKASGTITFSAGEWTWTDDHKKVISGTKDFAKGSYTFIATAHSGFKFDEHGLTTKAFTVVVGFDRHTGPCLTKVTPVKPKVSVTDVCLSAGDSLTVDSSQDHVKYTVKWNSDRTKATVTATVTDSSKYYFDADVTTSWKFTFTNEPCVVTVVTPPSAADQTCLVGQSGDDFTLTTGGVNVVLDANLEYTITGAGGTVYGPIIVTEAFTPLAPGDYSVSVAALNGFVLSIGATSQWPMSVSPAICVLTVGDPYAVPESCSKFDAGSKQSGHVWVDLGGNLSSELEYRIVGKKVNYVATQEVNVLPAGRYAVTATAKPGFSLGNQQSEWHFTIRPAAACSVASRATPPPPVNRPSGGPVVVPSGNATGNATSKAGQKPTLAFTGGAGSNAGLLLAGGLLMFGGTIVAFERRLRHRLNSVKSLTNS